MSAVPDITHLAHISAPEELRRLPGWLIWRYEAADKPGAKPRKVPYYAAGGRRWGVHGRPEDREKLVTFDAARAAAARRKFDGVGFAPLPGFGLVALDFDDCLLADGLHPQVLRLVAETYAEFSPSGHGVRAFFLGDLGNQKDHGAPFGFEVFSTKGFVTFTGNALPHVADLDLVGQAVAPAPPAVGAYCTQRFGARQLEQDDDPLMTYSPPLGLTEGQLRECLDVLPDDLDYDRWVGVGMAIHHETAGEGFEIWDEWSQASPKYTTREYGEERWRSFGKGGGKVVTARSLVKLANENGAHVVVSPVASLAEFDNPAPAPLSKPPRFQLVQAAAFAHGPPLRWWVKGVLPMAELGVVYGEPGSGKTFAVLDLVAAIARGIEWRGHRVRQGRVVYVVAEGREGFRSRLAAYAVQHDIDLQLLDLHVIADAPNLLLKDDALDLSRAIVAAGPAGVVVVDTLAQTTPGGNENSGEDMGKALSHCKGIHRATGATVLLVHHSGKDASKGARGWSGIKGAADAELEVLRFGAARVLQNTKMKDGKDGGRWAFDLAEVPLGMDEDGDVTSSCAVVEAAMPISGSIARPLGRTEAIVNAVIQEFAQAQTSGIEVAAVLREAIKRLPEPAEGKRDTRKQHAKRALEALCQGDDAPYWLGDDGCLEVV